VRAGVAAYVVDGLATGRVRAVLEVAMSRFQLMRQLRTDLDKAKADLASRRSIERAKALLMKERGLDEEEAYKLLRKLSMDSGRPSLEPPHRQLASTHQGAEFVSFGLAEIDPISYVHFEGSLWRKSLG
jgi:hypothetical protein